MQDSVKRSPSVLRRIAVALWPTLLVVTILGIASFFRVDIKGSNGVVDTSYPIRISEVLFVGAAILAALGGNRVRRIAGNFLICGLMTVFVLHFVEEHRTRGVPKSSLLTAACSALASFWNRESENSTFYVSWRQPDPRWFEGIGAFRDSLKYYAAWWIGATIGCSQDLFFSVWRYTKIRTENRKAAGSWSISLKGFLILVTLAAWTFGVLQMPIWRQRYAVIAMLVLMTIIAAILSGLSRRSASAAGKTWLMIAGVYLGFLFMVRGDRPATDMLDPCLSPTIIEIVSVPFYEPDEKWDWWYRDRMDNYAFLYDGKARAITINGTTLIGIWLATLVALLRYRQMRREEARSLTLSTLLRHHGDSGSFGFRLVVAVGVLSAISLATATACFMSVEQAAHFAMKATETGFLGMLIAAMGAQGRIRRFATRFLTVALAFLFVEQFATFYRLEDGWGDSPFLRFYGWLWNWGHGETFPPFEHERHLLLKSLTYLHVDYLLACDCIASWWLGGIVACALALFDNRGDTTALAIDRIASPYWISWRRVSPLIVTLCAIAVGIWLCNHPARRMYGMSILEVGSLLAMIGVAIPVAFWPSRSKRWLLALAVYLGLVMIAYVHDRKWSYWDFGFSTSAFDLFYLHLVHGEPLAYWKITPPRDAQLIGAEAKDFSLALSGVFGVWFASVAAICWRPDPEVRESAGISAN